MGLIYLIVTSTFFGFKQYRTALCVAGNSPLRRIECINLRMLRNLNLNSNCILFLRNQVCSIT